MGVEEGEDLAVALDLVLLLAEAVSFIVEDDIFDRHVVLAHGGDDVIGFGKNHARIVLALQHHQRLGDLVGVEQRRDGNEHVALAFRIADFLIERLAETFPVRRNAFQRAQPVADAEQVDANLEFARLECQRGQCHVTAVAATHDADAFAVDVIERLQVLLRLDAILQRLVAVLLVIGGKEGLAVTRAAAIVDAEHDITVVGEELGDRVVATRGLPAGATVHKYQGRQFVRGSGLMRFPQDVRDLHAIEALETHDAGIDQLARLDLRAQRRGQALGLGVAKSKRVQLAGLAVTVEVKRHAVFRARNLDATDFTGGQLRQVQRRAGGRVGDRDLRAAIDIGADNEILAGMRVAGIVDVPFCRLHVLVLVAGEHIAAQALELAALIAGVEQAGRIRREGLCRIAGVAGVRGQVDRLVFLAIVEEEVVVDRRARLRQGQPALVWRDRGNVVTSLVLEEALALVGFCVVAIEVEELLVTLVGDDIKRRAIRAEIDEGGPQLFARGQILFAAVGFDHIQVVKLVAALVARDQLALVGRKPGFRIGVVGGRGSHRHPFAAAGRHRVGVPDAGFVRGEQDPAFIRRERCAGDAGGVDEILDRVCLDDWHGFSRRRGGGCFRRWLGRHRRRCACGQGQQGQEDQATVVRRRAFHR